MVRRALVFVVTRILVVDELERNIFVDGLTVSGIGIPEKDLARLDARIGTRRSIDEVFYIRKPLLSDKARL